MDIEQIQIALSAYMTGLVALVQFCQYPLFRWIDKDHFVTYHQKYVNRTTLPIAVPMIAEMLVTMNALLNQAPGALVHFSLLTLIWVVTFVWSVPCHNKLQKGFDENVLRSLLRSNALRVLLWSFKTASLIYLL